MVLALSAILLTLTSFSSVAAGEEKLEQEVLVQVQPQGLRCLKTSFDQFGKVEGAAAFLDFDIKRHARLPHNSLKSSLLANCQKVEEIIKSSLAPSARLPGYVTAKLTIKRVTSEYPDFQNRNLCNVIFSESVMIVFSNGLLVLSNADQRLGQRRSTKANDCRH